MKTIKGNQKEKKLALRMSQKEKSKSFKMQ